MQGTNSPRCGDIEQPLDFVGAPFSLQFFQVIVGAGFLPGCAFGFDWRDQQMLLAIGPDHVVPKQQLAVIAPSFTMQAGQNDRIELQPFRFVDRHHLHGITRRIGRREEFSSLGREVFGIQ